MWSESRALLRPQFHKERVSDLHVFEDHVSKMLDLLPKDGMTVDMLPWWYRFALDASTDYLLGESVDSLSNPKVSPHSPSNRDLITRPLLRRRFLTFKRYRPSGLEWDP